MDLWELFRRAHLDKMPGSRQEAVHRVTNELFALQGEIAKLGSAIALADLAVGEVDMAVRSRTQVAQKPAFDLDGDQAVGPPEMGELFERSLQAGHWFLFAARGAVFALHEYQSQLQHIGDIAKGLGFSDDFAVETMKDLEQTFPHLVAARHAIAHAGDIGRKPIGHGVLGAIKGSIQKAAGGPLVIIESFEDRTLVMTRKGTLIKFEIAEDLSVKLKALHRTFEERLAKELFPLTV